MAVITWCWAAVTFVCCLLAYCSAHAEEPPEWAVRIMQETHKRVIVEHQNWYARDFRYVPAGEERWGNCATFSTTALVLAACEGHRGQIIECGRDHVVAAVEGWMFNAREDGPVPVACQQ